MGNTQHKHVQRYTTATAARSTRVERRSCPHHGVSQVTSCFHHQRRSSSLPTHAGDQRVRASCVTSTCGCTGCTEAPTDSGASSTSQPATCKHVSDGSQAPCRQEAGRETAPQQAAAASCQGECTGWRESLHVQGGEDNHGGQEWNIDQDCHHNYHWT